MVIEDAEWNGKQIAAERSHRCPAGEQLRRATREAQKTDVAGALWGDAITHVEQVGGQWWAHNEEYSSLIRFCPWCGAELATGPGPGAPPPAEFS